MAKLQLNRFAIRARLWTVRLGIAVLALAPVVAKAQAGGACGDTTTTIAQFYKGTFGEFVSSPRSELVQQRSSTGMPNVAASAVKFVADTTVCRTASIAYDNHLDTKRPTVPVLVLELGTAHRIVIKDTGMGLGPWLHMLFDQTFSTLITYIGL